MLQSPHGRGQIPRLAGQAEGEEAIVGRRFEDFDLGAGAAERRPDPIKKSGGGQPRIAPVRGSLPVGFGPV